MWQKYNNREEIKIEFIKNIIYTSQFNIPLIANL